MTFPDTLDEFLEQYQFKDSEEIYTNGSMLIPVFRVKQWAEHTPAVDAVEVRHGEWDDSSVAFYRKCSECGCCVEWDKQPFLFGNGEYNYCPNCGAKMDGKAEHNE
jgi:membrane protease subunit (stomatin/prohibitin family)